MTDEDLAIAAATQILIDHGVTPAQYRTARRASRGPLPTWDEMTDLDKGAALLHDHKREYEGVSYAVENYPCRYIEDPRLTWLDREDASDHAAEVCGDEGEAFDRLGEDEYQRLYNLALHHEG